MIFAASRGRNLHAIALVQRLARQRVNYLSLGRRRLGSDVSQFSRSGVLHKLRSFIGQKLSPSSVGRQPKSHETALGSLRHVSQHHGSWTSTTPPVPSDPLRNAYFPDRRVTSGLTAVFQPRSIAVVGATDRPNAVSRTIVSNLIAGNEQAGYPYTIYPINPTRKDVLGLPCFPSVENVPGDLDMAVIVTPAKTCVDIMKQCARKGAKAAIVISAGFKEAGPEGVRFEEDLIQTARAAGIRVIGPNCLGVMNPNAGLNATFAATMGLPGNLAFISQSGAMCTAVLDWSLKAKVGFSAFVSVGSMADVDWGDLLDYLGSDPQTHAILIYMETIGNTSSFLSAAKEVGVTKPIVVIKAGKSEAAAQAAASHTGSLAGSYQAFEAAMARVGVLTADTIEELFDAALVLGKQPRPQGPNLMIVTNAGGPAVLATDAAVSSGAEIAELAPFSLEKLNGFLPAAWSHSNPVDILGDASAQLYARTLEIVLDDPNADGVLVVLSPQDVTDPTGTAKALVEAVYRTREKGVTTKPVLAAWMGGETVEHGFKLLSAADIPAFSNPDSAARTYGRLWKQVEALEKLYGKPELNLGAETIVSPDCRQKALSIIGTARQENRLLLTEAESKDILAAYGVGAVQTILATTPEEAETATKEIQGPLYAVKLNSKTLTHKADVGGVKLNVKPDDVRGAFETIRQTVTDMHGAQHFEGVTVQPMLRLDQGIELILGSKLDPQFGPLVMFGSGGTMVEVIRDTALAVPPLDENTTEVLLMRTRIFSALKGGHGKRFEGVSLGKLKSILSRFSLMTVELSSDISECDVNPLLATRDSFVALDARIALRDRGAGPAVRALRPYPAEYIWTVHSPDLGEVLIRPTGPRDKEPLFKFHERLSSETVRNRYLRPLAVAERLTPQQLIMMCHPDYDRQITLAAMKNQQTLVGLCEIDRPPPTHLGRDTAQVRVVVRDDVQKKGLGKLLLQKAMEVAKREGITELTSAAARDNTGFVKLTTRLGWSAPQPGPDPESILTSIRF